MQSYYNFSNIYSRAAVWQFFLSCLCDICWTSWVFTGVTTGVHSPTTPLLSGASRWIHLHLHYRTNWHARRKANQIVWQQLGEEIAFPLSGRKASMLSLSLGFCWRGEGANGEKKGKLLGCSLTQVKSHPFPSIFAFASLSFHFSPHSFWQYRSVTQRHRGLHSSISSSSNNYEDRVALAAKLGPLRSQQHIVQPD